MKKSVIIWLHIGYWALYSSLLMLLLLMISRGEGLHSRRFVFFMVQFIYVPAGIGFYIFYTFLFHRFLIRKRIAALLAMGLLVALLAGTAGLGILLLTPKYRPPAGEQRIAYLAFIVMMAMNALLNGIVALALKTFITWYNDIRWKEELARKNAETELALVKSQMNPHFLFNTLNNIDVLIETDAEKASVYFKKLCGMLRFMLYETGTDRIRMSEELAYIDQYLELERIRSSHTGYIQYSVEGEVGDREVAPMVFIPFIENACKHAATKNRDNVIVIRFTISANEINFGCSNSYNPHTTTKQVKEGGIGNSLIQKRLQLLYPGSHQLYINTNNNIYAVTLKLTL